MLDHANPMATAREFVRRRHALNGFATLWNYGGAFFRYQPDAGYVELGPDALRSELYHFLERAKQVCKGNDDKPTAFHPTRRKIDDILDCLRAICRLPEDAHPPLWLDPKVRDNPSEFMRLRNGLLHLPSRKLRPNTPRLFTLNCRDIDFAGEDARPTCWLEFLEQLWPGDEESKALLQEWMGCLLIAATHYHKMMLVVGPPRSGKGTICRVVEHLVGRRNICAPTLASLGQQFGLSPLIGKSLALIPDVRLGGRADAVAAVERLLSISGEDTIGVPRKHREDFTGRLQVRFMLTSNELPQVRDASGAFAQRLLMLRLQNSFTGREDTALLERLLEELPRILTWALGGLERLQRNGSFTRPKSVRELESDYRELTSPVAAFVDHCCKVDPRLEEPVDQLFANYASWCATGGYGAPLTIQSFGKELRAVVPSVTSCQPRASHRRARVYRGIGLVGDSE